MRRMAEARRGKGRAHASHDGAADGGSDAASSRREEDHRLVQRVIDGDGSAFEELFTLYRDKVYGVVFGYVRSKEDALDITQEAFVRAYEKIGTFRAQSSFFTWITQIGINLSIDHCRKKKRRKTIGFEDHMQPERHLAASTPEPPPGRGLLSRELREQYEQALEQLSEKHRTVFVLHTVKGMAYKEIASLLEISIGTVMSRLFYARKNMQRQMEGYLGGEARAGPSEETG